MPTAYLSPSQLQDLTNVSSTAPGSGDNGKALVWNQAAGRWQAEQVAYSNLSGAPALPIPVADGGTGTQTGSITGTGELTFSAGGTNQSLFLNATGTGTLLDNGGNGNVITNRPLVVSSNQNGKLSFRDTRAPSGTSSQSGILWEAPNIFSHAYYVFNNIDGFYWFDNSAYKARYYISNAGTVGFGNYFGAGAPIASGLLEVLRSDDNTTAFRIDNTQARIFSTAASTSTTSGALRVDGGVGVVGNLNVGGTKVNFANLPISSTGLSAGDLWRDGEIVKVKL
jgi:hypothetical protein